MDAVVLKVVAAVVTDAAAAPNPNVASLVVSDGLSTVVVVDCGEPNVVLGLIPCIFDDVGLVSGADVESGSTVELTIFGLSNENPPKLGAAEAVNDGGAIVVVAVGLMADASVGLARDEEDAAAEIVVATTGTDEPNLKPEIAESVVSFLASVAAADDEVDGTPNENVGAVTKK